MANPINAKLAPKCTSMVLLGVLLACVSLTTQAANVRFLNNSLLAKLGAEEIVLLKQEVSTVLDKSPDQEIIDWLSPNTGIKVQIKPKLTGLISAAIPIKSGG
jgi:hypothetical protein